MSDETAESIAEYTEAVASLLDDVVCRLGPDYFRDKGRIEFVRTEKGRAAFKWGDCFYFRDERTGEPVASRVAGPTSLEFAVVQANGTLDWVPAGVPDMN